MTTKGSKHATAMQDYECIVLLKQVVTKLSNSSDGSKRCEYQDGHDDESVAKRVGVSKNAVARIRLDNFGSLIAQRQAPSNLERRLGKLEEVVGQLILAVDKLLAHSGMTVPQPPWAQSNGKHPNGHDGRDLL